MTPNPILLITPQNTWYTGALPCGSQAGALTISGHYFLQEGTFGSNFQKFLDRTEDEVRDRLINNFLGNRPEVSAQTTNLLGIDIEQPHLSDLHEYPLSVQDQITDALKMRVEVTREVFPNARLGYYGTVVPDAQGRANNGTYLARMVALERAASRGLFDQVNVWMPVLYPRFGPDDNQNKWESYQAYTELGVDGARQLGDKPVIPFLHFRISNGNSANNDQLLCDLPTSDPMQKTLGVQLAALNQRGVAEAQFWIGSDPSLDVLPNPNDNGARLQDFICIPR